MSELWKAVVGFEGYYEVSDLGRVRSLDRIDAQGRHLRGRVMKLQRHQTNKSDGYLHASFCRDSVKSSPLVHRLVLEAFTGPAPEGYEGAHDNGSASDNSLSNLVWKLPKDNADDRRRHGTSGAGEANAGAKLTESLVKEIRRRVALGESQTSVARAAGITQQTVSKIGLRLRWAHV